MEEGSFRFGSSDGSLDFVGGGGDGGGSGGGGIGKGSDGSLDFLGGGGGEGGGGGGIGKGSDGSLDFLGGDGGDGGGLGKGSDGSLDFMGQVGGGGSDVSNTQKKNSSKQHDDDDSASQHSNNNNTKKDDSKKKRKGWGGLMGGKSKDKDKTDSDDDNKFGGVGGDGGDGESNDVAGAFGKGGRKKIVEPQATKPPVVVTQADSENDYHFAIYNHDWEALETFLKHFDHTKYKPKPPPPKKSKRKMRIAKYLPENLDSYAFWKKKQGEPEISPLLCLNGKGQTPLHLACRHQVPSKILLRLLFVQRDASSVVDDNGTLPLHEAITHRRNLEVLDKLIRGYPQGSWQPDGEGRTPLVWAVEMARREQLEENPPVNNTYWGYPTRPGEAEWQASQEQIWETVRAMLENREARRRGMIPPEYTLVIQCLAAGAPPSVIELFITTAKAALERDELGGPAMSLCISRQYPLSLLKALVEAVPIGLPKLYKDITGRGLVSAHYKVGCVVRETPDGQTNSHRMTMQQVAHALHDLEQEHSEPSAPYQEWWEKMQFLISLWGSNANKEEGEEEDPDLIHEELLLHNALSNSDAPPSLIQLLAALYPHSTELAHPKSHALPIHLASRVWRWRSIPPRKGEKEISLDKVVNHLLDGDSSRCRKRYKDRLPLHHAIAAGKPWPFLKPLTTIDKRGLYQRDPSTKLYPFQLAAGRPILSYDKEGVTKLQFAPAVWKRMREWEQDHEIRKLDHEFELEQLTVIFELLRHAPDAINPEELKRKEEARIAANPAKRPAAKSTKYTATEAVVDAMLNKIVTARFATGKVSSHFIAFCYEKTRRGWKTHRFRMAHVKEAIMDGCIAITLDAWWRKLKIWIWHECPWENIPRRDEYLLHAALCNDDTPVHVVALLLECFPRSASIPLPKSGGCFPLHIACTTNSYLKLPFEVMHNEGVIGMIVRAYPDAVLMKWEQQLPLHLAIAHGSKNWEDMQILVEHAPMSLSVPTKDSEFYPFQRMAVQRRHTKEQRIRFKQAAVNRIGPDVWPNLKAVEKVKHLSKVLQAHEMGVLTCVWQLLRASPEVISFGVIDMSGMNNSYSSVGGGEDTNNAVPSSMRSLNLPHNDSDYYGAINGDFVQKGNNSGDGANLSMASLDFLEEVFETGIIRDKLRSSSSGLSGSGNNSGGNGSNSDAPSRGRTSSLGSSSSDDAPPRPPRSNRKVLQKQQSSSSDDAPPQPPPSSRLLNIKGLQKQQSSESSSTPPEKTKKSGRLHEEEKKESSRGLDRHDAARADGSSPTTTVIGEGHRKDHRGASFDEMPSLETDSDQSSHDGMDVLSDLEDMGTKQASNRHAQARRSKSPKQQQDVGNLNIGPPSSAEEEEHDEFTYEYVEDDPNISSEEEEIVEEEVVEEDVLVDGEVEYVEEEVRSEDDIFANDHARDNYVDYEDELEEEYLEEEDDELGEFVETFEEAYDDGEYDDELDRLSTIAEEESQHQDSSHAEEDRLPMKASGSSASGNRRGGHHAIKDVVVVTNTKAFIISKKEVLASAGFRKLSARQKKLSWVNKLLSLGQEVDMDDLFKLRHEKEQLSIASTIVDNETILVDEDDGYTWVLCGADAASKVENYDIRSTKAAMASFADSKTDIWLDAFQNDSIESIVNFPKSLQGPTIDRSDVLHWLWIAISREQQPELSPRAKKFQLTRTMLREAFSVKKDFTESTGIIMATIFDHTGRKLSFAFAQKKLREKLGSRKRIPVFYMVSRGYPYFFAKKALLISFAKHKFWKSLRSKQRKASVSREKRRAERKSRSDLPEPESLKITDRPKDIPEGSRKSSGNGKVIVPAAALPSSSYVLKKALKAEKTGRDAAQAGPEVPEKAGHHKKKIIIIKKIKKKKSKNEAVHLASMNQPKTILEDDQNSIGENDIFDPPAPPPLASNPLLAAALKAKQQNDLAGRPQSHSDHNSQPNPTSEQNDHVSAPNQRIKKKKRKSKRTLDHLANLNQPKTDYDDDQESLGDGDLFEPPKSPPSSKPLLAAAVKARKQAEAEAAQQNSTHAPSATKNRQTGGHLANLNQPTTAYEDDQDSLGRGDLFEPPKSPPSSKPLLAAAVKARKQAEDEAAQVNSERPSRKNRKSHDHLANLNQPKTEYQDDQDSLGDGDLFEPPKSPPSSKPLLAAAIKAREQAEAEVAVANREKRRSSKKKRRSQTTTLDHLANINQPKSEYEDDQDSLGDADLFEPPKSPPSSKPLLAAAIKARKQAEAEAEAEAESALSNSNQSLRARRRSLKKKRRSQTTTLDHLANINQPKTEYDDDQDSLGDGDLFEPPKSPPSSKPLLAAAIKARKQAEAEAESALSNSNQSLRAKRRSLKKKRRSQITTLDHLANLNQPKSEYEDDQDSLGDGDLFEPPKSPPSSKPLLAAAIKARKQAEAEAALSNSNQSLRAKRRSLKKKRRSQTTTLDHLANLNQPKSEYEDDQDSLGDADLFEPPKSPPSSKPLLAAAIKARKQAEAEAESALSNSNQSLRARRRSLKKKRGSQITTLDHLANLNQPKSEYEDDQDSLGDGDLFEPPKSPPSSKPLLAAAIKARKQAESESTAKTSLLEPHVDAHLLNINQPKTSYEEDLLNASLEISDVFDPPGPPPPERPLLAAALKARQSRESQSAAIPSNGKRPQGKSRSPTPSSMRKNYDKSLKAPSDRSMDIGDVFHYSGSNMQKGAPAPQKVPAKKIDAGKTKPISGSMVMMNSIDLASPDRKKGRVRRSKRTSSTDKTKKASQPDENGDVKESPKRAKRRSKANGEGFDSPVKQKKEENTPVETPPTEKKRRKSVVGRMMRRKSKD